MSKEGHIFSRMSSEELCLTLRRYEAAQHDLAAKTKEDMTYWHHFALAELLAECVERLMPAAEKKPDDIDVTRRHR